MRYAHQKKEKLRKSPLALAALMIDSHSLSWLKMETSRAEARNVESVAVISVATIYRCPLDQVACLDHQRPSPRYNTPQMASISFALRCRLVRETISGTFTLAPSSRTWLNQQSWPEKK